MPCLFEVADWQKQAPGGGMGSGISGRSDMAVVQTQNLLQLFSFYRMWLK